MINSTDGLLNEDDYEYPADDIRTAELIKQKIQEYQDGLVLHLETLIPEEADFAKLNSLMNEREYKTQMYFEAFSETDFLKGLIEFREAGDEDKQETHAVIGSYIDKVNEHIMDELDEKHLKIAPRPKTKKELFSLFKQIDMGIELNSNLTLGNFRNTFTRDLRYSANMKLLERGLSNDERNDFLRDVQLRQKVFQEKMNRVKEKERKKRKNIFNHENRDQEEQRRIHKEIVDERFKVTLNEIKRRNMQRIEDDINFKQYIKVRALTKPTYQKIEETYQRVVRGEKKRIDNRKLEELNDKFHPINFNNLEEHTKKYDAEKQLQNFKAKEKYGLDFSSSRKVRHPSNFDTILLNKEKSLRFKEIIQRKQAANKYAEEINKHFLPQIRRSHKSLSKSRYQVTKRRVNLPGPLYKARLFEVGEAYLRSSIDNNIKVHKKLGTYKSASQLPSVNISFSKSRVMSPRAEELNISMNYGMDKKPHRPIHKNYLRELMQTKVVKRQTKEWQNVIQNKKKYKTINEKYTLIKTEFDLKDKRIKDYETLKKQKATEFNENVKKTRGIYMDSIRAKLALLGELT